MRYILDDNGYVESVSCNHIECDSKSCTEYKGKIPLGYYSLTEWVEKANIRAYKIVDGTFTYDSDRAAAIESEMRKGFYPNKYSQDEIIIGDWFGKPIYRKVVQYSHLSIGQLDINLSDFGIANVESIWLNHNSFLFSSHNEHKPINNFESTGVYSFCNFPSTTKIRINTTNGYLVGMWNLIIEYTKTTDIAKEESNVYEEPDLSIDANIPVEPDIPTYTMADSWRPYNNCSIDGSTIKDNLNAWVSASNDGNFKGLSLDFTLTETHNLKASFEFAGYEGCPKHQTIWILKDDSEWLHEFTMYFDDLGTNFTRTINQVLETGSYKLIIGSYGAMDFGLKCTEVSLSTEIPQNLFDLSSYSFPTTKDGLTFNYDNEEKTLTINGESNDDFGLYIPLSLPPGNYTISYLPNQSDLGFYFSIDEISDSMLTGWGRNNKTFDVTSTTSQIILWFDAGYTYNNLELKFNLVKND